MNLKLDSFPKIVFAILGMIVGFHLPEIIEFLKGLFG